MTPARSVSPSLPAIESAATELKSLFEDIYPLVLEGSAVPPAIVPSSQPAADHSPHQPAAQSGTRATLIQGAQMAGTIALTLMAGFVAGITAAGVTTAIVAQRLPLAPQKATHPPLLERLFRGWSNQQHQVQQWIGGVSLPQHHLTLAPQVLQQWQPGQLEAEIDRLLGQAQSLEGEVSALETKLQLQPTPSQQGLVNRLLALRQAVNPLPPATLPIEMTLPTDRLFADGSTTLKSDSSDLLQSLENTLQTELQSPGSRTLKMTIATHTDNIGNAAENLELSYQRSRVLQAYFAQRFNHAVSWTVVGYGASLPVVDNSTQSNRQRNRRVEITVSR